MNRDNRKERIQILSDKFGYTGPVEFDENNQLVIPLDFICADKNLTSLEGAPDIINGHFYCHDNALTDLSGGPRIVKGDIYFYNNKLISLIGAPNVVGGHFNCRNNKLTSLIGAPSIVGEGFYCAKNYLKSLTGIPTKINGPFVISVFPDTPLLKILNVTGIKEFRFFDKDTFNINDILCNLFSEFYRKGSRGQLQCGIEMMRLGYGSNAKL